MPRVQRPSNLYLVARRAILPTMPATLQCFHHPAVWPLGCNHCLGGPSVRALSVCGSGKARYAAVPPQYLDAATHCFSVETPDSRSWDSSSKTLLIPRLLASRFLKGFTPVSESSPPFGPLSRSAVGAGFNRDGKLFCGRALGGADGQSASNSSVCAESPVVSLSASDCVSEADALDSPCGVLEGQGLGVIGDSGVSSADVGVDRSHGPLDRKTRRGVASPSRTAAEWRDLLTVPGIGRRNMEKLVAKGIEKLDELKQLYRDKYRLHGTEKMVEFLRSSVGVQKHHATSISVFIKNTVDAEEESPESTGTRSRKRLTFCVEGNISVGKTTFLHRIANETIELRDLVEVVPEPIGKWQDVGPDHFNILDAFYGDPERYAYTFQNYVFVTRMMQERESAKGDKRLRLMERSVFSDRMVFVRAVHEAKWMSDAEICIYDSWFDPVVSAMPGLVPDAFIYLRATPDTCHRRLQSRNREEETNVTLDYLRGLHEKHEQWLFPAERAGNSVLSVSEWPTGHSAPLSSRLQDRVLYLHGDNVHSSIQKVPALVLDCEPSIDFSKDVEAKAEYARQVADFFEYVQSMKDSQTPVQPSSPLILPCGGGLVGPDGNLLRPNSLEGVDLRRQISTVGA